MKQIAARTDREVWLHRMQHPYVFASPFDGLDFALLLLVDRTVDVMREEQNGFSDAIVAAGCRYAVCAGRTSSAWHDAIDWAAKSLYPDFIVPDGRMIMTTWHDGEPLEEVIFYFQNNTWFDAFEPRRMLVFLLGGDDAIEMLVSRLVIEGVG